MREPDSFHAAFAAALRGDPTQLCATWAAGPRAEAGLSVYRNTIAKGCADALVAQFPTLLKLVGEPWLAAAAVAHAADHPPRQASLLGYGQDFPDWLARFPPAAGAPYLADVARLDLLWTEAHLAADAPILSVAAIGALSAEACFDHRLGLHPAARFAWFETATPSLWRALQADERPARHELDDTPEGLLFVRPDLQVEHLLIGAGAHALLAGCRSGASLARAAEAALLAEPDLALDRTFAELIEAGAFASLTPLPTETP